MMTDPLLEVKTSFLSTSLHEELGAFFSILIWTILVHHLWISYTKIKDTERRITVKIHPARSRPGNNHIQIEVSKKNHIQITEGK
jgi:hypothetical protein